jgi:hypothetical protein
MSTADEYGNVCRLMSKADEEDNGALTLTHTQSKEQELQCLTLCVCKRKSSIAFLISLPHEDP